MILATDFDGTLSRGGISDRDRAAIVRFRAAGHLFGVVTGRDFGGMYHHLAGEQGAPFDFLIVMNGALILTPEARILFQKSASGEVLPALLHTVGEVCGYPMGCEIAKVRLEFDPAFPDGREGHEPHARAADIPWFTMANTHCDTTEQAAHAIDVIRKRHGAYLNPLQNGPYLDIPPAGVDKGTGIADYASLVGIPQCDIWTAGDNYNDLAMLTRYRGCAMENGVPAVKKASKGIYPDIAAIIEEMLSL